MRNEVVERLKVVKNGKVPSGYILRKYGIYPESWDEQSLEKVCDLVDYRGKTPKKTYNGVFLLTAKNIKKGKIDYEISQEYISSKDYEEVMRRGIPKKGDIVFTTEAPLGNVARIDDANIAIAQRVIKLRGKNNLLANEYIMYLLLSDNFQSELDKESTGSTVKGIKGARFKKLKVVYPKIDEQKTITSILSTWDKAIELKEKLIEEKKKQKKGLMQRLLTGELRLPGFDGEWEEVALKEHFCRVTRKNSDLKQNVLTISAQKGLINQKEYFNKSVASSTLEKYYLLKKGEFAYNKSYSNGYPMGAIKKLKNYDYGVVTTLYIYFKIKSSKYTDGDYFEHYFDSGMLNRGLAQIAHEGGRAHGLLNVSTNDFFDLRIFVAQIDEQKSIAKIINTVSKNIVLLEQDLAYLKLQKKCLMQLLLTGIVRVKPDEDLRGDV